jgi:dTDP-4-dehydrorhamnose 3,5-epimerase
MKNIFKDIKIFEPKVFSDKRGFFFESYSKEIEDILQTTFAQDNHSFSHENVVRGLHYQWSDPMGKLVRVTRGTIIDYFVDIRHTSSTYGQYDSIVLSEENKVSIWIPPGFAHGFEVTSGPAIVLYKCSAFYNSAGESGINPLGAQLGIPWETDPEDMIISDRDLSSQTFAEYTSATKF